MKIVVSTKGRISPKGHISKSSIIKSNSTNSGLEFGTRKSGCQTLVNPQILKVSHINM